MEKAKEIGKDKLKGGNDVAIAQIPEALPTASRFLSEAAAQLSAGAVPAVGFPLNVPPVGLSFEAPQQVLATDPRAATANLPAFTDTGVAAAKLLSTGAAHVAHATPIVTPAVPTISLPAGLQQAASA